MAIGKHRSRLQRALENCDVVLNGKRPWDPQINSKRVYRAFLTRGIVGLGEAYVDGWWDCEELDELCARICRDRVHHQVFSLVDWAAPGLFPSFLPFCLRSILSRLRSLQT